jgi:hypothetical protein
MTVAPQSEQGLKTRRIMMGRYDGIVIVNSSSEQLTEATLAKIAWVFVIFGDDRGVPGAVS